MGGLLTDTTTTTAMATTTTTTTTVATTATVKQPFRIPHRITTTKVMDRCADGMGKGA